MSGHREAAFLSARTPTLGKALGLDAGAGGPLGRRKALDLVGAVTEGGVAVPVGVPARRSVLLEGRPGEIVALEMGAL